MDGLLKLRLRLQRARERCASQPAFSPDWDAAMADVEDVTRLIWRFVPRSQREPGGRSPLSAGRRTSTSGHSAGLSFGSAGNFAVYVADSSGSPVGVAANELAAKGNSSSPQYSTGTLHLEINSECSWSVTVTG